MLKKIINKMDFFWLFPKKLAGGSLPRDLSDITILQEKGIEHIISLVSNIRNIQDLVSKTKMILHHIPIPNWGVPSEPQITRFLKLVSDILGKGETVFVHCYGGCGRTGTMLALYLIKSGYDGKKAMEKIREIRPCSVETEEQEDLVLKYNPK